MQKTPTILIVENNCNQRTLYAEELADEGYYVVCASQGCEALDIVECQHPDAVVLDINMPDMDGLEVLSRMLEAQPQLPVVINTAYATYQDSFLSWVADAYVVKSSDLSELKRCIRESLAQASLKSGGKTSEPAPLKPKN